MSSSSNVESYYKILQINRDATKEEIRKSYQRLAILRHPDKNMGGFANACAAFNKLNTAFSILSDPLSRAEYDKKLEQPVSYRETEAKTKSSSPRSDFSSDDETVSAPGSPRQSNFKSSGASTSKSSSRSHFSSDDSIISAPGSPRRRRRPESSNFKSPGASSKPSPRRRRPERSNFISSGASSIPSPRRRRPESSNLKSSGASASKSSPHFSSDDETTSAPGSPRRRRRPRPRRPRETSNLKSSGSTHYHSESSSIDYDSCDSDDGYGHYKQQQRDKDHKKAPGKRYCRSARVLDEMIRESMIKVDEYLKEMKSLTTADDDDDDHSFHAEWVDIKVKLDVEMRLVDRMRKERDAM